MITPGFTTRSAKTQGFLVPSLGENVSSPKDATTGPPGARATRKPNEFGETILLAYTEARRIVSRTLQINLISARNILVTHALLKLVSIFASKFALLKLRFVAVYFGEKSKQHIKRIVW